MVLSASDILFQIYAFAQSGTFQNRFFGVIVFTILASAIVLRIKKFEKLKEN
jgi:hypothetical protein